MKNKKIKRRRSRERKNFPRSSHLTSNFEHDGDVKLDCRNQNVWQ